MKGPSSRRDGDRAQADPGSYVQLVVYVIGVFALVFVVTNVWIMTYGELNDVAAGYDLSAFNGAESMADVNVFLSKWIPLVAVLGAIAVAIVYAYRRTRVTTGSVQRRRRR